MTSNMYYIHVHVCRHACVMLSENFCNVDNSFKGEIFIIKCVMFENNKILIMNFGAGFTILHTVFIQY